MFEETAAATTADAAVPVIGILPSKIDSEDKRYFSTISTCVHLN